MKKVVLSLALLVFGFSLCFSEIRGEKMFVGNKPRMVYYDTDAYNDDKYDYDWIEFSESFGEPQFVWEELTYKYDDTINMGKVPLDTDSPVDARFVAYRYIMVDIEEDNAVVEWFYTEDNEVVVRRWFYE